MQQAINDINTANEGAVKKNQSLTTTIPIRAYLMACLRNWYWFLLSLILCGCLSYLYSKTQTFTYESRALILIKTKDSNQGTQSQAFSDLGLISGNNFIPNEIYKMKSTDLFEKVVMSLGNNVQYYGHVFLRDVNIYHSTPVQVTPLKEVTESFTITVVPKTTNDFEFQVDDNGPWVKAHFGNKVNTKYGPVAITKNKNFTDSYIDFKVIARVYVPSALAKRIKGNFAAEQADKVSDAMNLSLKWDNSDECADILNAIIATYNQEGINDKNIVARSTEAFIADRVEALSQDLSGVDNQVAVLKTSAANSAIFADASTGRQYADNAASIDMQVSLAGYIQDYQIGRAHV